MCCAGDGFRSLDSGMAVEYAVGDIDGKPKAVDVTAPVSSGTFISDDLIHEILLLCLSSCGPKHPYLLCVP